MGTPTNSSRSRSNARRVRAPNPSVCWNASKRGSAATIGARSTRRRVESQPKRRVRYVEIAPREWAMTASAGPYFAKTASRALPNSTP
jgi:hypothetical protein